MKKCEIVFVILCYKETKDLLEISERLKSINNLHEVVVVNSFFDDKSNNQFKQIAEENNYKFLSIENRGYGYGNNCGINCASDNFDYDYICVVNPDVDFLDLNIKLPKNRRCIVGPEIITLSGKLQNPYYPYHNILIDKLKHMGCYWNNIYLYFFAVVINKVLLRIFRMRKLQIQQVYAVHGACFFIGKDVIKELFPLYTENMFLYNEEEHVARKALYSNIPIIYHKGIRVLHKEGGSSSDILSSKGKLDTINDHKWFELTRKSFLAMEQYWRENYGK